MANNFESFFNNWLNQRENLLQRLLLSITPENLETTDSEQHKNLITQVLSHYKLYYDEKLHASRDDVFTLLNPPWLSSFERSLLWLGEFKPSIVFRLVSNSEFDLTDQQRERMEAIKVQTRGDERELSEAMARIQESLAFPPFLNLAMRFGRLIDGEVSETEEAVEILKNAMLAVLESADALRGLTAIHVIEVLSPVQGVKLLAAAIEFQLTMRRWGERRDAQRLERNGSRS